MIQYAILYVIVSGDILTYKYNCKGFESEVIIIDQDLCSGGYWRFKRPTDVKSIKKWQNGLNRNASF